MSVPRREYAAWRPAFALILTGAILAGKAQSSAAFEPGYEYPLLVATVAISAFAGGLLTGIASSAVASFYYLYGSASSATQASDSEVLRLVLLSAGLLTVAVAGGLSRRWARGRVIDRMARAEAERAEKATARRLAVVQAASTALTESRTIAEASARILEAICESLKWDLGALWTVDSSTNILRCVSVWHRPSAGVAEFARATEEKTFPSGIGLPGRVWSSGSPAWIADVVTDDNFPRAPLAAKVGLHGGFGFPISRGSQLLGVIEFFSREIQQPDEDLLAMMSAIGSQIGQYLERLRAEEAVRQSEAFKSAILKSAPDCIITLDDETRIVEFNPAAERTFGYSRDDVLGKKIDQRILRPGIDGERAELSALLAGSESPLLGRRVELPAMRADGTEIVVEMTVTPVQTQGPPLYTAFLRDITEIRRAGESRSFLSDVGKLLTSSLNHEIILRRVAERSVPFLADCCLIDSVELDSSIQRVASAYSDAEQSELLRPYEIYLESPYDGHPVVRAMRFGETELISEANESFIGRISRDREQAEHLRLVGLESLVVVPLAARGRFVGAISLLSLAGGRKYEEEDVALIEELASRVGTAIDNALLYREKSRIARILQQSLLPLKPPKIPGLDIATRYRAAGEGADVGGDFYDVFPYGNHWAVVMGDVSGRGAAAAALTGMVRYTVRSEAMQEKEPTRILSIVNEAIITQSREDQFCTAIFARIDRTDQGAHLAIVCAGHPEPVVLRAGGELETVAPPGALLGAYPVELGEQLVDMGKGDAVVFYTDGIIEARSGEDTFGTDRLLSVIGACAGADAEGIAKGIEQAVVDFAGSTLKDDLAIVVLRVPRDGS